jgi:hypothetical protein
MRSAFRLARPTDGSEKRASAIRRERLASALREYRHLRGPRVLCKDDGRPLSRQSAWDSRLACSATGGRADRRSHLASHVLFALGNAWCAGESNSGTRRAWRVVDDAALHASESCGVGIRDSASGFHGTVIGAWRYCGDGRRRKRKLKMLNQFFGTGTGIRTPVPWLRTTCPDP